MALFSSVGPFSDLLALQSALERALESPPGLDLGMSGRGVFPAVNIFSDADAYVVRVEVPGVVPEQLNIQTQGRTLTICGRREHGMPANASIHRRERGSGDFSRSLQLPDEFDPARAEASYKHGILTVRIPKKEEAKPRQITVAAA